MISTKQITYALAVAKTLHFKKAAELCSVSQSALSSAITELERQLGAQVFERDNKRVLVTAFGEDFLQRARRIKVDLDDLEQLAKSANEPLVGSLKLGVIPTIAPYLLPKVLPAVHQQYPELRLALVEVQSSQLVEKVKAGELDAGILALPYPLENLHAFEFWQENFYVVMHKDNALAGKREITTSHLDRAALMLLEDGHCLKDHALAVCKLATHSTDELAGTSLFTLIQMVEGKMGVTLLPEMAIQQLVSHNPNLIAVPLKESGPHRKIAFITRLNYARVGDIDVLMAMFRDELG